MYFLITFILSIPCLKASARIFQYDFKRGFKLAGVNQMIVSLWSVPYKETMELMTLFYSDLTNSLNPVSSFEKAQKEIRMKYPTEPEKWAGFVLVRQENFFYEKIN
jgi:CHAT domain-containing protein